MYQIPQESEKEDCEIRRCKASGGKAHSFYGDPRLSAVLEWEHELSIMWLGSNDLKERSIVKKICYDNIGRSGDSGSKV